MTSLNQSPAYRPFIEVDFLFPGDIFQCSSAVDTPLWTPLRQFSGFAGDLHSHLEISTRYEAVRFNRINISHGSLALEAIYHGNRHEEVTGTILPGAMEGVVLPIMKGAGCVMLRDMHSHPYTLERARDVLAQYESVDASYKNRDPRTAEFMRVMSMSGMLDGS